MLQSRAPRWPKPISPWRTADDRRPTRTGNPRLADVGYTPLYGPELASDGTRPERQSYQQGLLVERLRHTLARLNPRFPATAREGALQQVIDLGIPALLSANRRFHQLLVTGVSVKVQKDGETRGDFARLMCTIWRASA